MMEIALTRGFKTIVDAEDYEWLQGHEWYTGIQGNHKKRAIRSVYINGKRKTEYMHRRIAERYWKSKLFEGYNVDHINGNPLDNRKSNLRICTKKQNVRYREKIKNGNQYKGATRVKHNKKNPWFARLDTNGKTYCSYHKTMEAAALKYNEYAKEHFGEFAKLNEVPNA